MSTPRILVTDVQDGAGLGAIRCAAAGGFQVSGSAPTQQAPGLWSRHCSTRYVIPDPRDDVDGFVERLAAVLRSNRHEVLIPARDETVYVLSARREQLEQFVTLGLPDHQAVMRTLSKSVLATEAARVGLASPESRMCGDIDAALGAAREFGFPVLVKGPDTIKEVDGHLARYPSQLVADEQALRGLQLQMGSSIVQRCGAGNVVSFAGVATEQGLLASVTSRYERTWPVFVGGSSYTKTVAPPGSLVEQVEALVGALAWRGVFELELLERHDGVLQAIDFNPRVYGSIALARAAGVPLVTLWCAWLLGERPRRSAARTGVHFRNDIRDARHLMWQLERRRYRAAARVLRPRRGVAHAYVEASDPMPAIQLASGAVSGLTRRLRRTNMPLQP